MSFNVPVNFEQFDFSYPVGACGNSSGWSRRGFDLARFPEYSTRRRSELVAAGRSIFFPMIDGGFDEVDQSAAHRFTFGLKVPPGSGGVPALSSGGGSALFRQNGKTYKMKRAGIANEGLLPQRLAGHGATIDGDEIYESTRESIPGLTELISAMDECIVNHRLRGQGFCGAYRPAGVLVIKDLPGNPRPDATIGASITEITSDVRMDEVVHMALSPVLAWLFQEKLLSIDHGYHAAGSFRAARIPFKATLARFDHVFARIEALGRVEGAVYRRLHDAGFVRGMGSAWFGNEVVERSGAVSVVDFDGGTGDEYPANVKKRCQQIELSKFIAESHMLLTDMAPRTTAAFAAVFMDGVLHGYQDAASLRVPQDVLRSIIDDHLAVFGIIRELFDLPDDRGTAGLEATDEPSRAHTPDHAARDRT